MTTAVAPLLNEVAALEALCRSMPCLDVILRSLSARSGAIGRVLDTEGPDGLVAIAQEVAAPLDRCPPAEEAIAVIAAQVGFLLGVAAGRADHLHVDARHHSTVH